MTFENWIVTDESISWNGKGLQRFVIPKEEINSTINIGNGVYYSWILSATDEDWLTQNDLYDLNYAFVYAVAKFGLDFSYEIFDATLAMQYEQFEAEDAEDPDE